MKFKVTPNKKGDRFHSHHPESSRIYPRQLDLERDKAGDTILAIFFLITKT